MQQIVYIADMSCPMCEQKVQKALQQIPGVTDVNVSWQDSRAVLTTGQLIPEEDLTHQLAMAGYTYIRPAERKRSQARSAALACAAVLTILGLNYSGALSFLNFFPTADENTGYFSLFVIGVMTSFHCVSMCGGINLGQSSSAARSSGKVLRANLLYQTGRILSYSLLGGIAGLLGSVFSVSNQARGLIMILAAMIMVIMALNLFGAFDTLRHIMPQYPVRLLLRIQKHFSAFGIRSDKSGKTEGSASMGTWSLIAGLLNGLMPCGPLQSMQIYALSTGSFVAGAVSMFLFCAGTVPLLFLFGWAGGRLSRKAAGIMMKLSASFVLALGIIMLGNGLSLAGISLMGGGTLVTLTDIAETTDAASSSEADSGDADMDSSDDALTSDSAVSVISGDIQIVSSEADYGSYEAITVQSGVAVEWHLMVPEGKLIGCNNQIIISEYGIEQDLQEGDNLISFLPEECGTYTFTCWMGMIRSTITVVEDLDAVMSGS